MIDLNTVNRIVFSEIYYNSRKFMRLDQIDPESIMWTVDHAIRDAYDREPNES